MKVAAKQVLVDTANKNGIPWQETVREFQNNPEVRLHARSAIEIALVDGGPITPSSLTLRGLAPAAGLCPERRCRGQGRCLPRVLPAALPRLSQGQSGLAPCI